MKCQSCEADVREEDDFCPKCGHVLRKRVSPGRLEEIRIKAWLDRVKSNRRWGLLCLVVGVFVIMLGFYTADMIVFVSMNVVKEPSVHWELITLGSFLSLLGYHLLVKADKLEKRMERGEIPSVEETG